MAGRGQRSRSSLCLVTSASASASASGDLWRAAGSRLWPPPLLLIGRPRGERRRAWCEGMVGRDAGQEATAAVIGGSRHSGQLAPPRKLQAGAQRQGFGSGRLEMDQKCILLICTKRTNSPMYKAKLSHFVDLQEGKGFWWWGLGVCHVK